MTDNFNTEYTERLHINLAKDAFHMTNTKDKYPQMTAWLSTLQPPTHSSQLHWTPVDSQGLQWTNPSQSTEIHVSPQEFLSVHWISPQSTGMYPSPVESTSVHRSPPQSSLSLVKSISVHRNSSQSTGFHLHSKPLQSSGIHLSPQKSSSVHRNPLQSTGIPLSSVGSRIDSYLLLLILR